MSKSLLGSKFLTKDPVLSIALMLFREEGEPLIIEKYDINIYS